MAGASRGWIHSRALDLPLFVLSPLAGAALALFALGFPGWAYRAAAAAGFLLAIPHYLTTFTFFLGDEDRAYYKSRLAAVAGGPLVILASVVALRVAGFHGPVLVTMFVWNLYHAALQSAGIQSLYRRLNGGPDEERRRAKYAILFVNAAMAFWHIDRFPPLYGMMSGIAPFVPDLARAALVAGALWWLGALAVALARRARPMAAPEASFLATSLLLFHPYLWVRDFELATLATLTGHFIQYLALVWLLHRRRYAAAGGSRAQHAVALLSGRLPLLLAAIAVAAAVFYAMDKLTRGSGAHLGYVILINTLALTHFYLDGIIWAFRRPYVRQTLGAFLTPASQRAVP